MPVYLWVAETKKGRRLKGEIDAANEKIAISQLKKRNFTIKKLKPKPKDLFGTLFLRNLHYQNIYTNTFETLPVFLYLVAIMDWYLRYVLSLAISNKLDSTFCFVALNTENFHICNLEN